MSENCLICWLQIRKNRPICWLQFRNLNRLFIKQDNIGAQEVELIIEEDKTAPLLSFRLPKDNLLLDSTIFISPNPEVKNLRIIGDLRVNEKVTISGDVIGGSEEANTIQMFITISKNFHELDLQNIGISQTEKVFLIPLEALSHYLVAKYTPATDDGKNGKSIYVISNKYVENSTPQMKNNVRGESLNKKVAALNHECWSRHLGKIVRDGNICPALAQTWTDMTKEVKDHMWDTVKKRSKQSMLNKANTVMHHKSGSRPHRAIIYDMGGKDGNPAEFVDIFFATRAKDGKLPDEETTKKYEEIKKTVESEPLLSTIEVIDKCFRPQTQ